MQWIIENWIVLLLGGGMVAMHLFGHKHGHKGKGHGPREENPDRTERPRTEDPEASKDNTNV